MSIAEKLKKIFFENVSPKQTILKNTFWLAVAEVATSFLRFILFVYAARILGAAEYGKFAYALSFVLSISVLGDLGVSSLITRNFSQEREKEKEYPAIISLKIILSFFMAALLFISSFFIAQGESVKEIIWVLTSFIFIDGFFGIIYPFIRARQKMEYEATTRIAQTVLAVATGLFVIFNFPSAVNLGYAYLFSSIIILAIVFAFFHFFLYFLKLEWNTAIWKKILKDSWPFSLGFIGAWTQVNVNSAMIGFEGLASEVGWYNAAAKIILAGVLVVAGLFSRSFYPLLSKFFKQEKEKLQGAWDYYMEITIVLTVPLIIGGFVFASQIINFLYGLENYGPAVPIFQILIFLAGVTFLYYPFGVLLAVAGEQKKNFFAILLSVIINIFLNIIFMPKYGISAVAVNTVVSSAASLFLAFFILRRHGFVKIFNKNLFKILIFSLLSGAIMLLVIKQPIMYNFHILAATLVGAIIYMVLFFSLKVIIKKFS
jgi:O-antigen/teichoic acid export membrane protein